MFPKTKLHEKQFATVRCDFFSSPPFILNNLNEGTFITSYQLCALNLIPHTTTRQMEQDLRHVLEEKARMDNREDGRQSPRLNIPLVVGAALIGGVTSLINTLPTPKPLPLLQNHPMCGVTTGGKVREQSIILCSKQPAVILIFISVI